LFLCSCTKQDAVPASTDRLHATVVMRDGNKLSGSVVSSTPSEVQLTLDDGTSRVLSMKQVRSISYDDGPAAEGQKAASAAETERQETDYYPEPASIQTKTYVVPVGTEVSVRTEETIDSAVAVEGQTFAGEVTTDVKDADKAVVVPHGSNAQIVIKSASKG